MLSEQEHDTEEDSVIQLSSERSEINMQPADLLRNRTCDFSV